MAEDPYVALGVARDATPDQIKQAYRKLARQHHPDLNPGKPEAETRFKAASSANEILSDPDRRARFDRGEIDAEGQERAPPPPPGGSRTGAWRNADPGAWRNADPGAWRNADPGAWRRQADAPQGSRYDPDAGHGGFDDIFAEILAARRAAESAPRAGADETYRLAVPFRAAVLGATEELVLPDGRRLSVKIPPGVVTGQSLRLRGQGEPGRNGGPAGNAVIELDVADDQRFRREGFDLYLDLPVTLKEAVLGGAVEVPALSGTLRVTLPAASDTGRQIRLRGKGVAAHGTRPAGDLLLTLRVQLGQPDAALAAFLRDWQPENPENPRDGLEERP